VSCTQGAFEVENRVCAFISVMYLSELAPLTCVYTSQPLAYSPTLKLTDPACTGDQQVCVHMRAERQAVLASDCTHPEHSRPEPCLMHT
jgi:hypothetical protein